MKKYIFLLFTQIITLSLCFSQSSNENLVGSIPGTASVGLSGQASYEIPIEVAPGISGMQPQISLVYNSQAGNGIVGWGFNITGLSAITRIPKNIYFDGEASGIKNSIEDQYALDGNRMIATNGTHGQPNCEYRTEIDNFSVITAQDNYNNTCPEWFKVVTKDGLTINYGNDSGKMKYRYGDKQTIISWLISAVKNYNTGQSMYYDYETSNDLYHYISSIKYGNNAVEFFYETRTDVIPMHVDMLSGNINKRLKKIIAKNDGQIFRQYDLEYDNDTFSRLVKITESNGDGEKMWPTIFSWDAFPSILGMSTKDISVPVSKLWEPNIYNHSFSSVDINGDGLSDIIGVYSSNIPMSSGGSSPYTVINRYIAKKENNGTVSFQQGEATDLQGSLNFWDDMIKKYGGFLSGNVLGTEKTNIILPVYDVSGSNKRVIFHVLTEYKDYGSKDILRPLSFSSTLPEIAVSDVDNNGYSNIIYIEKGKNNSGKYVLKIIDNDPITQNESDYEYPIDLPGDPDRLFVADFDGDGMPDIMIVTNKGYTILWNQGGSLSSCFSNTTKSLNNLLFNSDYSAIEIGDFNGDGLPDFVLNERCNRNWYLALNTGKKTFTKKMLPQITALEEESTTRNDDKDKCFVFDFDGDGKSDILISDSEYRKRSDLFGSWMEFQYQTFIWYRSTGSDFELVRKIDYDDENPVKHLVIGDFTGNGQPELINYGFNCLGNESILLGKEKKWRLCRNSGFTENTGKIASISDGLNNNTNFSYKPLTDKSIYQKGSGSTFPVIDMQVPLSVVMKMTQSNIKGTIVSKNYKYEGAKLHAQGRGFLGFKKVTEENNTLGLKTITESEYNNTYFNTAAKKQITLTSSGTEISSVDYTNAVKSLSGKRFFPYVSNITQKDQLTDISVSKNSIVDDNGNLTKETTSLGSDVTTVVDYTYIHAAGNGITPNKVSTITTTKTYTGEPSFTTKQEFAYNTDGILTKQTDFANVSGKQLATSYQLINSIGLPEKVKVTANGYVVSENIYRYDTQGRVLSKTDILGNTTTNAYDNKGNLISRTDPLGNTTSYQYNSWGQLYQTTYPTGSVDTKMLKWARKDDADMPNYAVYKTITSSTDKPDIIVYYDGLSRELRTVTKNINGQSIYVDKIYNAKGQLEKVTNPSYDKNNSNATIYTYDTYGRLINENKLGSLNTNYAYDKRTTVITSPAGRKSTKIVNAAGDLIVSKDDAGNKVEYTYHSSGQPRAISSAGVVTTMAYDACGRQSSVSDPSAGTKSYEYDAAGNVLKETDANNKVISMQYGRHNRLEKKIFPEFSVTYAYNTNGSLKSETASNGNSTVYTYDGYGRLLSSKENVVDGKSLQKTLAYHVDDLSSVTYNSQNEQIAVENYLYTNGYLSEIKLNGETSIWKLTTENVLGQATHVTTGPIRREYWIDDNGISYGRCAISDRSGYFQSVGNNFELSTGNLLSREDFNRNIKEDFTYDNLDRLTEYSGMTARYDNTGNVLQKSDVGSFAYQTPGKPYAISEADLILPQREQQVTYTSFMRPNSIVENNYNATFTYNGSGERVRMNLLKNGANYLKRYYVSDQYEIDQMTSGTKEKLYLGGDAYTAPAVYVKENSGSWNIYYICRDYLGSITHITDGSGLLVQELSYDAWGRLRNPSTQIVYAPDTEPGLLLGRGYTSHEHLAMLGLVNMNARLYDPMLGRFLSPDPYVQAPEWGQNFNRYSYGLNNPMKYSDQTGEWFGLDDLVVAGIGFTLGYVSSGISTKNWGWKSVQSGLMSAASAWVGYNTAGLAVDGWSPGMGVTGMTWDFAGSMTINTVANSIIPPMQVPISNHFGISISPTFGLGNADGRVSLTGGMSLSGTYIGNGFSVTAGTGILTGSGDLTGYNVFAGGSYFNNSETYSFYYTYFGGKDPQNTWLASYSSPDFSLQVNEDMPFSDKYRTCGVQIGGRDWHIGTTMYTTDKGKADVELNSENNSWASRLWGKNTKGTSMDAKRIYSNLYLGVKRGNSIYRIGIDSPWIQDAFQNGFHRIGNNTSYIKSDYETPARSYYYWGANKSYTLY